VGFFPHLGGARTPLADPAPHRRPGPRCYTNEAKPVTRKPLGTASPSLDHDAPAAWGVSESGWVHRHLTHGATRPVSLQTRYKPGTKSGSVMAGQRAAKDPRSGRGGSFWRAGRRPGCRNGRPNATTRSISTEGRGTVWASGYVVVGSPAAATIRRFDLLHAVRPSHSAVIAPARRGRRRKSAAGRQ